MGPVEELQYLILAIQREGQRLIAADLRPLGVTPSQAEAVRVLAGYQPLTLLGLGELLVCATGNNPSRLVDRLVAAGTVRRETDPADRRQVTLHLTASGERLADEIAFAEQHRRQKVGHLIDGLPVDETLTLLRALASAFPAGRAVARRANRDGQTP